MMDWTEVQRTIKSFMKSEVLGGGFVEEYYDSFAYTLTQYLKELEREDAMPTQPQVDADELRKLLRLRDVIREVAG